MKSFTTFVFGTFAGIYIDQNYNIPKIATFISFAIEWIKNMEETLRKDD